MSQYNDIVYNLYKDNIAAQLRQIQQTALGMNRQDHPHKFSSLELEDNQGKLDFYKLHYPNRKSPQSVSKASNKMRSKSVVSVLESNQNQQLQAYNPKGSVRKQIANRQIRSQSLLAKDPKNQPLKYKQILSFKTILSGKTANKDYNSVILPFNSQKQLQQMSKNNINVRMAIQKSKDEKIKMNKIVMSHKQSEEVKLDYLRTKREEVQSLINQEINAIYIEFFKKEYEMLYGPEDGQDKFQNKLADLVTALSHRLFNN